MTLDIDPFPERLVDGGGIGRRPRATSDERIRESGHDVAATSVMLIYVDTTKVRCHVEHDTVAWREHVSLVGGTACESEGRGQSQLERHVEARVSTLSELDT
jgi:hypothetical protein